MVNPDGVVAGCSKANFGGVDMNRRWGENVLNACATPELSMLKEYIMALGEKVSVFIDIQGHSMADGLLLYSSQGTNLVNKIKNGDAVDGMELDNWFIEHSLSKWMHMHSQFSDEKSDRFLSYREDRAIAKQNSSRCVVFNELCIPVSTIVETSFFGFTNKKDTT